MVPMAMATAAAATMVPCAVAQGLPVAGSNEKSGVPLSQKGTKGTNTETQTGI